MKMKFNASLDKLAKVVTFIITIIFVSIIIGQLVFIIDSIQSISLFSILILVIIYLIVFLYRPIYYTTTDKLVVIHRPISDIKINLIDIKSVELLDKERLKWTIRTFGVGGFFGYWGKFTNSKIGVMTWYATKRENAVLITTFSNKKILLTPDNPELFVSVIRS
ncbi:MAG: PH domain-containing protein [Sediminibacterium sp.]